jgi:hypothetical protein
VIVVGSVIRPGLTILLLAAVLRHGGQVSAGPGAGPEPGVALQAGSAARFATVDEGRKVLRARDAFVRSLSPFDRQVRLRSEKPVSEARFLSFVTAQVLPWRESETAKLEEVLAAVRGKLSGLKPLLPEKILLVKTTGREEGGAPYTRGHAVILPEREMTGSAEQLERLLLHELFHILSRHLPRVRAELYRIIGFERRGEIALPPELRRRKITNPDAPRVDVTVEVTSGGKPVTVAPVLFSSTPAYDARKGGGIFRYLTFKLLVVEKRGERWAYRPRDGKPLLLDASRLPSYHDKIGRNTSYIIHPEEVLAENFVLLVQGKKDLPTPRIVGEMRRVLQGGP